MAELNTPLFLISIFFGILIDAADERVRSRWVLWAQQMHVLLWKNVYLKRLCRHYPAMLFEVVLMIVMLLGIQEETVVREPLIRRGNTVYPPVRPRLFWNTNTDMVKIHEVYYYAGDNAYLHMLTRKAFADLGVSKVIRLASKKEVLPTSRTVANQSSPVRSLVMEYWTNGDGDNLSVDVTFYTGRLPFDVQVQYPHRLIAQPEGPAREERFPEMNTLLPIVAALQQRHLRQQAVLHNYTHPVEPVTLRRFPYPAYIEHHDTKNYALVLTRFCVGMLVPFALFVAILTEEKASGMKEMLRLVGLNDWVFWVNHYLSGFFMHTVISTLMMLFVSVKRNHEGHPFIEYSDPSLIFFIMMCFCSSCLMHGTLLSLFFATPASAVAGSLLYWTFCCLMPFLALEQIDGQGYHYIQSKHKLLTAVFPGMSLHWSFRVLERFEKFVDGGANWSNFFDSNATPDNVTLAEILLVGILTDCCIITSVWYIDNVFPKGPGIPKPYTYPFKVSYWIPSMTVTSGPAPLGKEGINFESEPKDQSVAIEVVHANKDYDGVVAVQDLSLRVFENQITVLLGHNGAGKTTLLNMICGFVDFSSGVITIGGYDIKNCTREARESIGYCPQHNILFDDLTVEEHVMFFALMKGIKRESVRNGVVTLLNDVRLMQCRHMMAVDLSLGEQRRLCIAIAVLGTPKVIIMDEPTANMDPDGRREIWELLLDIRRSSTIFLTTQHLDEADILADRTVVMANGRIRCIGSPTFLKQRFGTGYHMRVNKMSGCKVARIETVLRKFAPKVTLSSDSDNEAIFVLGEIVATRKIIAMFKALESKGKDLGIESVGLTVTSLEDVLILVGEDQHVHDGRKRPGPEGDELRGMENRLSTVRMMTNATGGEPTLAGVIRAMVVKRAVHVWREKRMPLFSWLMPVVLLSALFILENVAIKGSGHDVERTGDTLEYSFTEVFVSANGFLQADTQDSFLSTHLNPMLNEGDFNIERPDAGTDIVTSLLGKAAASLRDYVFHFHFGVQMTKKTGTVLWFNGEIEHSAVLVTTLFNNARLRNITNATNAMFNFYVTLRGLDDIVTATAEAQYTSQNTYHQVLPEVLRSIFFPLCSSLMCSNFVLFPIAERAMQVKHLHVISGVSPFLYWLTNYVFDFSFYMGTALLVLPPVVIFMHDVLTASDINLILALNCLHGYAALPIVYIFSFIFDSPGNGFMKIALWTFIISATGCCGAVFMDHFADDVASPAMATIIGTLLQVSRISPSNTYSRGMIKVLQLARENAICRNGGAQLARSCSSKINEHRLSLRACCEHLESADPSEHAIHPLDMNPYSAFYEVLSLSIEGVVMFAVLLILEAWLPRLNMSMTRLEPQFYGEVAVIARRASVLAPALRRPVKGDEKAEDDTDVMLEDQVVAGLVGGVMMPSATPPFLVVSRLYKAYGYSTTNSVLQGLSFTVQKGECFGLLGVNGVGKTTMFRILTGQLLPHEGDALISGFSLVQSPRLFLRYIGYCPERDGLLDMLTGRETVLLFGRLRGVTLSPQYMHALLDTFRLSEYADQLVGTYSSGNRRKLSLCVATLGLPPLLLLDEPYVGISAGSLKRITNYISDLQKSLKLSIVLTSHSMSDVEFLCNRIAILSGGRLQCLGSLAHLKEKFGQGYTILVKTYPDRKQDAAYQHELANAITRVFPQADLIHTVEGQLEFRMSRVQELWSNMFIRMARIKRRFKLQDFFITDTSLEQIFLSVTRKEASDAAAAVATAAREPQATVQALLTATSLGI